MDDNLRLFRKVTMRAEVTIEINNDCRTFSTEFCFVLENVAFTFRVIVLALDSIEKLKLRTCEKIPRKGDTCKYETQGNAKSNYCVLRLLAIHFVQAEIQRLPSNKLLLRNMCIFARGFARIPFFINLRKARV